jgi:hypothetical protein
MGAILLLGRGLRLGLGLGLRSLCQGALVLEAFKLKGAI